MINAVTPANVATCAKFNLYKIAINKMTVIPIITMFYQNGYHNHANIAPIKLPVACSDIVFIERYILGCIAK